MERPTLLCFPYDVILNLLMKPFRETFKFTSKCKADWFPGHMRQSFKQIQSLLTITDCIIEVHDARIPFSGRNVDFKRNWSGVRPQVLVLNKSDLLPPENRSLIVKKLQKTEPNISDVIFTSSLDRRDKNLKTLLPKCLKIIKNFPRFERGGGPERNILVVGIPNVGKSSIINYIRNHRFQFLGNATRVGANPGVTRAIETKIRVNEDPLVYLWDSPGILFPYLKDDNVAMKLALCKCVRDDLIGERAVADYLLFSLNKLEKFQYVSTLGLEEPLDDINDLLRQIAVKNEWILPIKNISNNKLELFPDLQKASIYFLKQFRLGKLGRLNLDENEIFFPKEKTIISV